MEVTGGLDRDKGKTVSIDFACTDCHKRLRVDDHTAGSMIRCPGCGTVQSAPLPASMKQNVRPEPPILAVSVGGANDQPQGAAVKPVALNPSSLEAARKLPTAVTVLFIAVAASIIVALIIPQSAMASFPLSLTIGIWVALLSFRSHAWMSLIFSLFPLMFTCCGPAPTAILMVLPPGHNSIDDPELSIRVIVFIYAIMWIPLGIIARVRACRAVGNGNALGGRWLLVVVAGTCGLTAATVPICRAFFKAADSNPAAVLAKADTLWSSGDPKDRIEAVKHYKSFLNRTTGDNRFSAIMKGYDRELPKVFRRVIEYEADYGDPGEAVDWIRLAADEHVKLSLSSEKAKKIAEDVSENRQAHP